MAKEINQVSGVVEKQVANKSKVVNSDNEFQNSVWTGGDKNNNGIVDTDDFENKDEAKIVEKYGYIGKSWDTVKSNILNHNSAFAIRLFLFF